MMTGSDHKSASRLATMLLNQGLEGLSKVADTNRELLIEWLAELTTAQAYLKAQGDLLAEAVEDVRAVLQHSSKSDNVVPLVRGTGRECAGEKVAAFRAR